MRWVRLWGHHDVYDRTPRPPASGCSPPGVTQGVSARVMDPAEAASEDALAIRGLVGGGVAPGDHLRIRGHAVLPGKSREADPAAGLDGAVGELVGLLRDVGLPDAGCRRALGRIPRVRWGATDRLHMLRPDCPYGGRNCSREDDRRDEQWRRKCSDGREGSVRSRGGPD